MDEDNKSLWNKTADDLTVGDAVKLNGLVLIATIGVIAAFSGACVAAEKIADKRRIRKAKKTAKNDLTVVE